MRYLHFIIYSLLFIASFNNQVEAQSFRQAAKQADQQAKELRQQEQSRYNSILDSKDLAKYNQYLEDYPNGNWTPEIRKRVMEIKRWNEAKSTNSIVAYERYLNTTQYHWYDTEATNAINSLKQKAEKKAWDNVVATNTMSAYQQYLQDNPSSGYRQEAERSINRLQGEAAWQKIRNSDNIAEIQDFIDLYPNATEVPLAKERLHELKGCMYYYAGNPGAAYSEFSHIDRDKVSYPNQKVYDYVMEHSEFLRLGESPTEAELNSFIRKYPNSKYSKDVSNKLAIAKARNFSIHSSNYDYDQALSYAKDTYTRNSVKSYISLNKSRQKAHKKSMKYSNYSKRDENGGTVNFGLEFLDLGFNGVYEDCTSWYYNVGLMLRFGNYKDPIQFAIGLKPGIFGYTIKNDIGDEYYYYYDTVSRTTFHMPVVCQLKLNLFHTSENSRFFIYGKYQYNRFQVEDLESEMAWGAGCGFAWKHFDLAFYYRQDFDLLKKEYIENQSYFGISMIYYWKI